MADTSCAICAVLKSKHFQEDRTQGGFGLPSEAGQLIDIGFLEHQQQILKKCPHCDNYYFYEETTGFQEWFEELRWLTPAEVEKFKEEFGLQ